MCAAATVVLVGCSGANESAGTEVSEPAASSPTETSDASTSTTRQSVAAATSTVPTRLGGMQSALSMLTNGRLLLIGGDEDCLGQRVGALGDEGEATLTALIADPTGTVANDPAGVEPVLAAYLGCIDPAVFRELLVMSVLKVPEPDCVTAAWDGLLSSDAVASSLAYGDVLDDLPADNVERLVSAAAHACPIPAGGSKTSSSTTKSHCSSPMTT